ncbi:MAG: hypothetical protein LBH35_08135 [Treponema sp.]|nr:hypothetical protein [Treponema sp.]
MKRIAALALLCLGGAVLNVLTGNLFRNVLGVPLFMDTLFTVAMTFYGGPVCGVLTGLLTNPIVNMFNFYGWADILYALCNAAAALVTFFFIRLFPAELGFGAGKRITTGEETRTNSPPGVLMNTLVALLLLSFVMCVVISIQGGLIAILIQPLGGSSNPGPALFKSALFRKTLPPAVVEILARIPLNVIDRLLSVFGGCGVAALLWRFFPRKVVRGS